MSTGEIRYFATPEGRDVPDRGGYEPEFNPSELNDVLKGALKQGRSGFWRRLWRALFRR